MIHPSPISRRDFLENAALLGGGMALAGYPGAVRDAAAAEPNSSPTATPAAVPAGSAKGLSPQTIAVIGEVAKRNVAGFNSASTAQEHIANHTRDCDALIHAFRQENRSGGNAFDPAYNRAVVDALAKGERTKTHAFNKKMSEKFGA